jgi:hypothetical protein
MGIIQSLRSKPQHVRTQYAFVIALLITAVIAAIWMTTLPARFSGYGKVQKEDSATKEEFSNFVSDAKTQFGNVIESQNEKEEDTSRMGDLSMDESAAVSTTTLADSIEPDVVQTATTTATTLPVPTQMTQSTTTSIVVPSIPPPTQKVILIGTTTSSKNTTQTP